MRDVATIGIKDCNKQMTKTYLVKVLEKRKLAGNSWTIVFERPEGFEYEAGQYVSIKVSEDGQRRSYSLASWPTQETLELMADVTPMGLGSTYLLNLNVGDVFEILGPMGMFVAKDGIQKLMVATGSGIVPFRSMIHDLLETKGDKGLIRLDWGMRFETDLFWVEEFKELEKKFTNFKFDVVLSKPTETWNYCSGHVNDCLIKHQGDWRGWEAYLCGNQRMIAEVSALLQLKKIPRDKVYFEKFY